MKHQIFKLTVVVLALLVYFSPRANAQLFTQDFTLNEATQGNDVNLSFNKINLSPTQSLIFTLTITSITNASGTFQSQTTGATIPSAVFQEVLTLNNIFPDTMGLTETDNYTGATAISQNNTEPITISTSGPNSYVPLPSQSMSFDDTNLVNFEGTSGIFSVDVMDSPSILSTTNAVAQNYHAIINGTVTVRVVPEPSTRALLVAAGVVLLVYLRRRQVS